MEPRYSSLQNGANDPLTEPGWFCLRTDRKHEHLAAQSLRVIHGLETFAPRIRFKKPTRRGAVWFMEALFPSYIFARFSYAEAHRQVQYAPGVTSIVRFGGRVTPIPSATIGDLQSMLGKDELLIFDPQIGPGDRVQITEGALRGLEVVVLELLPAKERVKVLMEFLGRETEAVVETRNVLPVLPPRQGGLPRTE
jgi:transcriptional antiterminator RfaH